MTNNKEGGQRNFAQMEKLRRISMKHSRKNKISALLGVALAVLLSGPAVHAYPDDFGDPYFNDPFFEEPASSSEYVVTINAYSPEDGSYLSRMKLEVKTSSGSTIKLKKHGGYFSKSSSGSETIETDETGGATIKLPEGVYTIFPYSSSKFEPSDANVKVEFSRSTQGDSIDIEYYPARAKQTVLNFTDETGNLIQGGEFEILDAFGEPVTFFNNNDVLIYTEGNGGKTTFSASLAGVALSGMPDGAYKLSVVSMPAGYSCDSNGKKFNVTGGQAEVAMMFHQSSTSLTVSNMDKDNQYLTSSGFSVTDNTGTVLNFMKLSNVEYVYSDAGTVNVITFEEKAPVLLTGLQGNTEYTISEVNVTPGYTPADPQKITLQEGEQGNIVIQNKNPAGSLTFSVLDDQSSESVSDASFIIKNEAGDRLYFSTIGQGDLQVYAYDENGTIGECKTGKDGKSRLIGVPEGHISAEISDLPDGYTASTEAIPLDIIANETLEKEIRVFKSNAIVDIRDENGNPVEGVEVSVYNDTGESVLTQKTNEQGKILLSGLEEGNYTCLIASVPETYSFDDEIRKFSISSTGLAESLSPITLKKIKIVVSIGSSNGTGAMDNAVFALYNGTGEELSRALTNTSGSAYFTGLTRGDYTIKELSAPIGYKISDYEMSFTVDEKFKNGDTVDFSKGGTISPDSSEEGTEEDEDDSNTEKERETPGKKGVNVSSIFMIVLGVLVILFIIVSVWMIVDKAKESKKSKDHPEAKEDSNIRAVPYNVAGEHSILEGKSPEEIEEIKRQLEIYYTNNSGNGAGDSNG